MLDTQGAFRYFVSAVTTVRIEEQGLFVLGIDDTFDIAIRLVVIRYIDCCQCRAAEESEVCDVRDGGRQRNRD